MATILFLKFNSLRNANNKAIFVMPLSVSLLAFTAPN